MAPAVSSPFLLNSLKSDFKSQTFKSSSALTIMLIRLFWIGFLTFAQMAIARMAVVNIDCCSQQIIAHTDSCLQGLLSTETIV